jgi:hypothetical protein
MNRLPPENPSDESRLDSGPDTERGCVAATSRSTDKHCEGSGIAYTSLLAKRLRLIPRGAGHSPLSRAVKCVHNFLQVERGED